MAVPLQAAVGSAAAPAHPGAGSKRLSASVVAPNSMSQTVNDRVALGGSTLQPGSGNPHKVQGVPTHSLLLARSACESC